MSILGSLGKKIEQGANSAYHGISPFDGGQGWSQPLHPTIVDHFPALAPHLIPHAEALAKILPLSYMGGGIPVAQTPPPMTLTPMNSDQGVMLPGGTRQPFLNLQPQMPTESSLRRLPIYLNGQ